MSTLIADEVQVNESDETATAVLEPEVEQSAPEPVLAGATESEQATIDKYKASEERVVELAIATLDPKDRLKKYAKLGREALKLAQQRKASLKPGSWIKSDLDKVCSDLELLVKMRVPIQEIRIATYVRVHLWVEAVRPLVANVEELSYHQVANKFLPSLAFDPIELKGSLRDGWVEWTRQIVEEQLGENPLSMKEIDAAIEERKTELKIEAAERKGKDADKALEAEKKAADAKQRSIRRKAQSTVAESLDKAIADGHANESDVNEIVTKVLADHNLALPATIAGFDPKTCTIADVKTLARDLMQAGKLAEMRVLHSTLGAMISIAEKAFAVAKSA